MGWAAFFSHVVTDSHVAPALVTSNFPLPPSPPRRDNLAVLPDQCRFLESRNYREVSAFQHEIALSFPFPLLSCCFSFRQKAVELMCLVPKRCNDMMNLGRLQGFEVSPQECA